jgi:hypothetical protein
MSNENWIAEQEQALLFDRGDGNGEAIKLLEKSATNRDLLSDRQGKLIIIARLAADRGFTYLGTIADQVELAQMNIGNQARKDYMKVSIEQWQGKQQSAKNNFKAMV